MTGSPASAAASAARSSAVSRRPFDQRWPATVRSRVRIAPTRRAGERLPGVTRWTCTDRPAGRSAQPSEGGLDRAAGVDGRHRGAIGAIGVDVATRPRSRRWRARPRRRSTAVEPSRAGERRLDGARAVGASRRHRSGRRSRSAIPPTVREDDRRDADDRVARRRLLERRVGRAGVVAPAGQPDLGQDLARLERRS